MQLYHQSAVNISKAEMAAKALSTCTSGWLSSAAAGFLALLGAMAMCGIRSY